MIGALVFEITLLVVLLPSVPYSDVGGSDLWERVFGTAGWLERFVVVFDGIESVKLLLNRGKS